MKYFLGSKKHGKIALIEYENGLLKCLTIEGNLSPGQIKFIGNGVATIAELETTFEAIKANDKTAYLDEISLDLSFERFWEEYGHKVGKKERVKKKWDLMPDDEKYKALKHIKKYNNFLSQNPGIAKKYPETFLSTSEWNN